MDVKLNEFPSDKQLAISSLLDKCKSEIPHWLLNLSINNSPFRLTDGCGSSCNVDYEYRVAWIYIHLGFWDGTTEEQLYDLVHEIYHITVAPLAKVAQKLATNDFEKEAVRVALESVVVDLTNGFKRKTSAL